MNEMFTLHTEETAPEAARPLLKDLASRGLITNLQRLMAGAPSLLAAYRQLWALFDKTSLSPIERQVVYQTANVENRCIYCVPWHTKVSQLVGMAEDDIKALRERRPLTDPRLEALRRFTQVIVQQKGHAEAADLEAFFAHGWSPQQALEVILGVTIKTLSNYTNALVDAPLDKAVAHLAWEATPETQA